MGIDDGTSCELPTTGAGQPASPEFPDSEPGLFGSRGGSAVDGAFEQHGMASRFRNTF